MKPEMMCIDRWTEIAKGLYEYESEAGCRYEIVILIHDQDLPVEEARANLYKLQDWKNDLKERFFVRELMYKDKTVEKCMETAYQDNEKFYTLERSTMA